MFLHLSFGHLVNTDEVIAIAAMNSETIQKDISQKKKENKVTDLSHGRKAKSAIFMSNGIIILTVISTDTIAKRLGVTM